ncbi:AAA family ATPase [Spirosoma validum]|uniref:ATP-binding protein n=1 Tax=Spirosoma validum TaxID=2771355 RepID=A0A927GF88_9BACT|nr:ATP-binding protein [Spirosoma validum]MBD2755486.1 ATP-binding protein [Spirosoma validum]
MLIEFSVGNFLSIKDRQTLRLDASSITEHRDQLIDAGRYKLLRSAVIYGANASGKSNILRAIETLNRIVVTSAASSSTTEIEVEPFLLSTETEGKPSAFEILFLLDGIRYRYGFEIDRKAVKAEWLFMARKEKEKPLFLREANGIEVFKDFKEGNGLEERTRDNALFLAICDQFNGVIAKRVIAWFNKWLPISGLGHDRYRKFLFNLLDEPVAREDLVGLVKQLNLGFSNILLQKEKIDIDNEFLSRFSEENKHKFFDLVEGELTSGIKTIHKKYNFDYEPVENVIFDLGMHESAGTNKFFDLLAPIYLILTKGGILIVDELDAKLHPLMTQAIIRLFNNPELNPNNAQLIFATHDTNLLSAKLFRRDQIYFTEKDRYGATSLYSLVEYQEEDGTKVRKDRSFEEDYIRGRYGAIPFIGDLSKMAS